MGITNYFAIGAKTLLDHYRDAPIEKIYKLAEILANNDKESLIKKLEELISYCKDIINNLNENN